MLGDSKAFGGFAVKDLEGAERFYGETLGIEVERMEMGLLQLKVAGGTPVIIYPKDDHQPANYTILNFPVADVDATVDALAERGVKFERYDGFEQDDKGIARGQGPAIAWFTDPSGNILSVLEEPA